MSEDPMTAWVDERLAAAGRTRTGELTVFRERTWATVRCAPTDAGPVWLKETKPGTATEVRLYEILAEVVPERILVPLGLDTDRGWLLLPDGGTTLRDRVGEDDAAESAALAEAYPAYADLQLALAPHVARLLACGVRDMRPEVMPQRLDEALTAVTPFVQHAADDSQRRDFERLREFRPEFAALCAELAASGAPASIDHNDLHAANILGAGSDVRFYDWGDAVVAHPFACLLLIRANLPAAAAERAIRPYLTCFGDPDALTPVAELATRVACVARSLVWLTALGDAPLDHEHAAAPFEWLRRTLRAGA